MQDEPYKPAEQPDRWLRVIAKQAQVARDTSPGRGFLYRRGRLLVEPDVLDGTRAGSSHAHSLLHAANADRADSKEAELADRLGLALLQVDDGVAVPSLVREVRTAVPAGAAVEHIFVADPGRMHGCAPAKPADRPTNIPGPDPHAGTGLKVAVLDTGLWPDAGLPVSVDPADHEVLDDDDNELLDPAAGHGTFVTGLILEHAPRAEVIVRRLLKTPAGIASELEIAEALLDLPEVDVINCSFGGPGQSDAAPLIIERALAELPPGTVVVAAAGNQARSRPHWPAASKRAVGVAWVEGGTGAEGWRLSEDSSYGPWVDACAPGSDALSCFVKFKETSGAATDRDFQGGADWSGTSFATPLVTGAILALASRDGIPVREAVYRLIEDPARPRIRHAGTLVIPDLLPAAS